MMRIYGVFWGLYRPLSTNKGHAAGSVPVNATDVLRNPGLEVIDRNRLDTRPMADTTDAVRFGQRPWLPSGEHTKSNGKWSFIVDFPIKNGDFPLLC